MSRAVRISKFLALVLRHDPARIGLTVDAEGWVDVDEVLAAARRHGLAISRPELDAVVRNNPKQRFTLDPVGNRIRANQGHSIDVDLGLTAVEPPPVLYHGTSRTVLERILEEGLRPMGRHHVHLSGDAATALVVGRRRHGPAVVLTVDSRRMHAAGHRFYRSVNGVWLTDHVPPGFLTDETRHD
jgi:putative RNA 2'-phosphotransferase